MLRFLHQGTLAASHQCSWNYFFQNTRLWDLKETGEKAADLKLGGSANKTLGPQRDRGESSRSQTWGFCKPLMYMSGRGPPPPAVTVGGESKQHCCQHLVKNI